MNFVLFSDMFYVNLCHNVATMSFVTLVRHPPQYRLYCTVLYCTVLYFTVLLYYTRDVPGLLGGALAA